MRNPISILILLFLSVIILSCNKDNTNPVSGITNVASEFWKSYSDGDTINNGSWILYKKSDNSKTTVGTWKKMAGTNIITCPFNEGPCSITIFDSTYLISFTATGTATNSGYSQNSPFTLKVSGGGNLTSAVGNYTIKFSATGWPDSVTGFWTAIKQSGSGVSH